MSTDIISIVETDDRGVYDVCRNGEWGKIRPGQAGYASIAGSIGQIRAGIDQAITREKLRVGG
jgi:hypothetical protein